MNDSEDKLRRRWGKDIPFYDELDPMYIPLIEDWLPIPMIIDEKTHRRNMKILEERFTNPTGINHTLKIGLTSKTTTRFRKNRIPIPQATKDMILEERGNSCEHCRQDTYDQWHHINNDSSDNRPENIELLCYRCHKVMHMGRR